MWSKIKKLFWRILFIPVSGLFVLQLFTVVAISLNTIIYKLTRDSSSYAVLRYDVRDAIVLGFSTVWIVSLFLLEICASFSHNFRFHRVLTNLRYAAFFILLFSTVIVIFFDLGMIEYSKWRIRNYVYSASGVVKKPDFRPHNDYRGWCGNGYTERESYLYFDIASEGINDENPNARARAFLITLEVQDFFNGGDFAKMNEVLRKTCNDSEIKVKNLAEEYLLKSDSSCGKYLPSK